MLAVVMLMATVSAVGAQRRKLCVCSTINLLATILLMGWCKYLSTLPKCVVLAVEVDHHGEIGW